MKVKDVMHRGVTWVDPTTSVLEIAKKMRKEDIGAVPIGENDKLVGMVTDRDIVCRGLANGKDFKKLTARDVMSKGIFYCRGDDDLDNALEAMGQKHIRRMTVLDGNKRMVGILSLGDVAQSADPQHCKKFVQSVATHHA